MASSGCGLPASAMTACIMCRRRMRRAWSCIQPAWKAASWRLSAKMISFLCPSGAALIIAWARMWTSETVTAWILRAGSIVRPPIGNDGVLHDGQADKHGPKTISGSSGSAWPQPSARQRSAMGRGASPRTGGRTRPWASVPIWSDGAAVGFFQQPVGQHQPGAGRRPAWGTTRRCPAVVVLGGVAVLEAPKLVVRSP